MILKYYFHLEFILIKILSFFFPKKNKGIAIIRMDAIGDYILFRNFLKEIKKDPLLGSKKLVLIGNQAWKEIALEFDSQIVDEFIWINRSKIWTDKTYRFKTLFALSIKKYDFIFNPVFSREFHYSDSLLRVMSSKNKIGFEGDLTNIPAELKHISDSFYSTLIKSPLPITFEFNRNVEFFSNVLKKDQNQITTQLKFNKENNIDGLAKNYIVFFIGGSAKNKRWNNHNFIKLSQWMYEEFKTQIVFCGIMSDLDAPTNLELFNLNYSVNLIGKTRSILELIPVLSHAKLVVSNETAVPHICVALNVPVFVISHTYGRFTPYPESMTNKYFPIFHPKISNSKNSPTELSSLYGSKSNLEIDEITLQSVIDSIKKKTNLFF